MSSLGMYSLMPLCVLAAAVASAPSGEEILASVADTTLRAISYSGLREYKLRNIRFAKEATVTVREVHRSGERKQFTVLERSGSTRLVGIVERLLASEAEGSGPEKHYDNGINSANYEARLHGTETIAGRLCYVLDLKARHKSKYLINGTLWVDANSYGMVRLEGSTAASISIWIGTPKVVEEFSEVAGYWLPSRTRSVSSGRLLGASELEIRYTGYQVVSSRAAIPLLCLATIPSTHSLGCHTLIPMVQDAAGRRNGAVPLDSLLRQ